MIPENSLSTKLVYSDFIPPGDREIVGVMDYELGGIALSDPSQGLEVQPWTLFLKGTPGEDDTTIWIKSATHPESLFLTIPGITRISLSFDQNMHPCVAYYAAGQASFYWYDTTIPGYDTIVLDPDARFPYCTLDDKRDLPIALGNTDIILTYLLQNTLFFRMQRDKFLVEYPLLDGVSDYVIGGDLVKDCMNKGQRLQFFIAGNFFS